MDESVRRLLEADLEELPAATRSEGREYLGRVASLSVSESTLSRVSRRVGWSQKDRWERDEFLRTDWQLLVGGSSTLSVWCS